jgi:hypothetical protein
MITFSHGGNVGDLLAALPALIDLAKGEPATLYLKTNQPALSGKARMTGEYAASLLPLLQRQPYLAHVALWRGEPVDMELDAHRTFPFPFHLGDIARYPTLTHLCCPDFSRPWLHAEAKPNNWIVVNRTARYHNPAISYAFLRDWRDVRFVGLVSEYVAWRKDFQARGVLYEGTANYWELAKVIRGCRVFIGNQSSAFQVAQGLMVPRVLEGCPTCCNVAIHGRAGYDAFSQEMFEKAVTYLIAHSESVQPGID